MASCGKKNDATPGGTVPKSVTTYFAGTDGPNAVYWQNGKEHALTVNEQGGLNVFGMAVAGPDVYITGFDGESNAVYWKNGVASVLPIYAQCVAVSGTDVYFAGWRPGTPYPAAFIKDGVYKVLPTFGGRAFPNTPRCIGKTGPNIGYRP